MILVMDGVRGVGEAGVGVGDAEMADSGACA
jgi:hypothetical protein